MLSVLANSILIVRLKVLFTEASSPRFEETAIDNTDRTIIMFWYRIFGPVYKRFLPMIQTDMLRVILIQLQVFYSVIRLYPVNMMDSFVMGKFSPDVLFHNVPMMKNSFTVYIYSKISQLGKEWLALLEIVPVWRYIVATVTTVPRIVQFTNPPPSVGVGGTPSNCTYLIHYPNHTPPCL